MNDYYVLRYHTGEYVAIDISSGGYPYSTTNPNEIKFFHTLEAAKEYNSVVARGSIGQFSIEKVYFQTAEVK